MQRYKTLDSKNLDWASYFTRFKTYNALYCNSAQNRAKPEFSRDESNNLYYECRCISTSKFDCELSQKYRSLIFIDGQNLDRIKLEKRDAASSMSTTSMLMSTFTQNRPMSGMLSGYKPPASPTLSSTKLFHKQTIIPNLSGTVWLRVSNL